VVGVSIYTYKVDKGYQQRKVRSKMTNTKTQSGFYTTPKFYFFIAGGFSGNGQCKHENFSVLPLYAGNGDHIQHSCNDCMVTRRFQRYAGKKGGRK
jgi:hypothetical protein